MKTNTYTADSQWIQGSAKNGPKKAIETYQQHSGDRTFQFLFDHADRNRLEDGSFEYVAHPYLDQLGKYSRGAKALEQYGWKLSFTGPETSEYAHLNAVWTSRVTITRMSRTERLAMARKLDKTIEAIKKNVVAIFVNGEELYVNREVKYLEEVKGLLLKDR